MDQRYVHSNVMQAMLLAYGYGYGYDDADSLVLCFVSDMCREFVIYPIVPQANQMLFHHTTHALQKIEM